ncbi:MAG: H-NS family nucleoid-associated regulatory protein [Pseudomonadota bacterium]
MATDYLALAAQIKKLQSQAETAKNRERPGVIRRIKAAIAVYGLTAEDLGLTAPRDKRNGPKVKHTANTSTVGQVKFRDDAGNTWSGRGPRPSWVKAAIEAGTELQSLPVKSSAKKVKTAKLPQKTPVTVKYRDHAGNSWSGKGPRPAWLKAAIANGATLEGFATKKRKLSEIAGSLKPAPGTHVSIEEMRL